MNSFQYAKPKTLYEALSFLRSNEDVKPMAGGTDLLVAIRHGSLNPKYVLDIKGIESCRQITEEEEGIRIGAAVSLNEITNNELIQKKLPILVQACHGVGSYPIRNRGTLVGNICNASPAADTAPALYCLEAKVVIATLQKTSFHWRTEFRKIPIEDFLLAPKKTSLKKDELVISIEIPKPFPLQAGIYRKASRTHSVDLSTLGVAIQPFENEIRIAIGAAAPTPVRARTLEKGLHSLKEPNLREIVKGLQQDISPISDIRGEREYRRHMAEILTYRGLQEIKEVSEK